MTPTEKPLLFFDLETTGTNIATDRIVSLAYWCEMNNGWSKQAQFLFNPGIPIPPGATECHGITDEMVMDKEPFAKAGRYLFPTFNGVDLAGFNLIAFDVPLLWEEFHRAGIDWNLDGVNFIDAGIIFKKREPRTLGAAVQFYCNRTHESAHDALGDVLATRDVLGAQLQRYPELSKMTRAELAAESQYEGKRFDLAGKIGIDVDGDPFYTFGKHKGCKVKQHPSFGYWMMDKDFPASTKSVLGRYLAEIQMGERDYD